VRCLTCLRAGTHRQAVAARIWRGKLRSLTVAARICRGKLRSLTVAVRIWRGKLRSLTVAARIWRGKLRSLTVAARKSWRLNVGRQAARKSQVVRSLTRLGKNKGRSAETTESWHKARE